MHSGHCYFQLSVGTKHHVNVVSVKDLEKEKKLLNTATVDFCSRYLHGFMITSAFNLVSNRIFADVHVRNGDVMWH